jgi:hypothetical protein
LNRYVILAAALIGSAASCFCQAPSQTPAYITPGDNLVIEMVPQVPVAVDEQTHRYG